MQGLDGRINDIRGMHSEFRNFYEVGGGLTLVLLGVVIGAAIFSNSGDYQTNLYTEFLSICVTVLVLDTRAQRREARRRRDELRERLLREAASSVNETVRRAVEELERGDYLRGGDGWLAEADLERANLHGINLERANLRRAKLSHADLRECVLFDADLEGADLMGASMQRTLLSYANLRDSYLGNADLREANLQSANLTNANLNFADLRAADLSKANLKGTMMYQTQCDDKTILPDGSHWQADVDLAQFGVLTDLSGLKPNYLQTDLRNDDTIGKTPDM